MYPSQSHSSENIWAFLLKIIVFGAFLLLGADLVKAAWLSRPIAEAQANDMRAQTEITRKNAELDYEQRKFYAELERQQAQQQAAAQAARDAEALAFQKNLHATVLFGVEAAAIGLGLGLAVASVFGGIGLHRYLATQAQVKQTQHSNGRWIVKVEQLNRQVCALQDQNRALQSKVIELEQRENHHNQQAAIKHTRVEWPDDPEDYLSRIPPSWAG